MAGETLRTSVAVDFALLMLERSQAQPQIRCLTTGDLIGKKITTPDSFLRIAPRRDIPDRGLTRLDVKGGRDER